MQTRHPIAYTTWLYLFLTIHLLCWTLTPAFLRLNLPLDAMEGTMWGHELQWGYDKNPFLNAWLTAFAIQLGDSGWGVYLFSQLSVVLCMWSVWQLAKRMLPITSALLAVFLLETIQYFNFHAIDFNDNTLELGLWGVASYFFYCALRRNHYYAWLLTGVSLGLGMMAKYYTAALIAAMGLHLVINHRRLLNTLPPYLGLLVFVAICTPHIIWLFSHEFVTVTYVLARAASTPTWTNHLFFPWQFLTQQLHVFIPTLLLLCVFMIGKRPVLVSERFHLSRDDKQFLFYIGLGPILLTLLLSLITGTNLRAGWGMPLLSLTTIMLVACVQPNISLSKLFRFFGVILALLATALFSYGYSLIDSKNAATANFPGKELAAALTQEWHDRYHTPLQYVAGSRWVGANIGFYSKDHPSVFPEWNPLHAAWIDPQKMQQHGALFIWEISAGETLPSHLLQAYPRLSESSVREYHWQRDRRGLPPVRLGIAFLPPNP